MPADRRLALYRVLTWDTEAQEYKPQEGVPAGPYTLFGLRWALRALRRMGYAGRRRDPALLVEKLGGA